MHKLPMCSRPETHYFYGWAATIAKWFSREPVDVYICRECQRYVLAPKIGFRDR